MQRYQQELITYRQALNDQIEALQRSMEQLGAAVATTPTPLGKDRRGRPSGRPGSLKSYIVKVLRQSGRPLSPKEIASRAKRAGYKSKAQDLSKAVGNALPDMREVKKAGFGQYRLAR